MSAHSPATRIAVAAPLAYFGLAGAISLTSPVRMQALFETHSGALLWLVLAFWAVESIEFLRSSPRPTGSALPHWLVAALVGLGLAAFVFSTVPVRFKLFYDETELLATANALARGHDVRLVDMGLYTLGGWDTISYASTPWRPLFFPFLVHVVHGLVGIHASNAFVANFLCFAGLVAVVFAWVRSESDPIAAFAAALLVAGCPVLTIWATSGGFDVAATAWMVMAIAALHRFLRSPGSRTLSLLLAQLLVLSHTRHESIAIAAILACAVLASGRFRFEFVRDRPWGWAAAPSLLLPVGWLRALATSRVENTQTGEAFSIAHFEQHGARLLRSLVKLDTWLPYPTLALWVGLAAIALVCVRWTRTDLSKRAPHLRTLGIASSVILISLTALHLAHFSGDPLDGAGTRFFLAPCLALALAPVLFRVVAPDTLGSRGLLGYAVAVFLIYHPVATQDRLSSELLTTREVNWAYDVARGFPPERTLVIAEVPMLFTALDYGAVSFDYANRSEGAILRGLARHAFDDVLVLQELSYKSRSPIAANQLDDIYSLEPLRELQVAPGLWARMSRVRATDPSASPAG